MIELILYGVLGLFLGLSLIFIFLILTQKSRHLKKENKVKLARNYLFKKYIDGEDIERPVSKKFFFDALIDVDEQIHLDQELRKKIIKDICNYSFINKQKRLLNSRFPYRRKIAAFYLGRVRKDETYKLLITRFLIEKNEAVKLRLVSQMRYCKNEEFTKIMIESLVGSSDQYHQRLCTLLGSNFKRIYKSFISFKDDKRFEIVLGFIRISAFYTEAYLVDYMLKTLKNICQNKIYETEQNKLIIKLILQNLLRHTPEILSQSIYLNHTNPQIKKYAILSLGKSTDKSNLIKLVNGFDESDFDTYRLEALSKLVFNQKKLLDSLLLKFSELNYYQKQMLIKLFSDRIDYILLKYKSLDKSLLKEIIQIMLNQGITEPIIDFLNQNPNQDLQALLISFIKPILSNDKMLLNEFRTYTNSNVLKEFSITKKAPRIIDREKPPLEKSKIFWLIRWLLMSLFLFPIIYILRFNFRLIDMNWKQRIEGFIIDVNIYLIAYFVIINIIYIILLVFALIGSKKQVNLSKTRKYSLLFMDQLLPGISIIAPAYNEDKSIIDSVTSLLNLNYPRYEVVVVNDGSKDLTLTKLIEYFNLERIHVNYKIDLGTKPIRGVYKTKTVPNLLVIDKHNGGKADALNVGINVSQHDYVCGIDADSILEGDALLKLASVMLDDVSPHVALGGNIYPANGFTFDRGKVETRGLPKNTLCRFQTIEYLRAFTSGRIGWSELRSLMIISGAFGLFKRDVLIETGGYLTSSSIHKKDTVGEDMELVVRLTKQALEKKDPFRVVYVYNAYCYTELPSDIITLLKQRNRWQRGLIDILSYHRKLALNPKYKQIGFLGYPYYFLFEFLGPFFEMQGYIMLIIALILGLLNPLIILGIFTASIAFGVMISLSALFMTEREILMLNKKETFLLILFAILENFGYRQMISLHRIVSTFKALKESGKWGSQKRKGFKT